MPGVSGCLGVRNRLMLNVEHRNEERPRFGNVCVGQLNNFQ